MSTIPQAETPTRLTVHASPDASGTRVEHTPTLAHQVQTVVFDWAGTLVDFGSFAPTQVLVEAFSATGLALTLEQARGPMGMGKWEHIQALCALPEMTDQFRRLYGRDPSDKDVTAVYEQFLPLQEQRVADYSDIIPGAKEALAWLRAKSIQIGSCSGYPRRILSQVVHQSELAGLTVDCHVATDEVRRSRPGPGMLLRNMVELGTQDVRACVKVDDTPVGILEGHHAGTWTVALVLSGNACGLTLAEYDALADHRKATLREGALQTFADAAPHFCIDTIADLPEVIRQIDASLHQGTGPHQAARMRRIDAQTSRAPH